MARVTAAHWAPMEANVWQKPPGWSAERRLHGSQNLYFIAAGRLRLTGVAGGVEGRRHDLLIAPRATRYDLLAGPRGCVVRVLRVRLSSLGLNIAADAEAWRMLMELARLWQERASPLTLRPAVARQAAALIEGIRTEQAGAGIGRLCRIKAGGLALIGLLSQHLLTQSPAGVAARAVGFEQLRAVIGFIEAHFADPIGVADLARVAELRRSRFHALFRACTGLTPVDYITRVRIGQACRLLRDTADPVLSIGLACGFGTASRFYEAFTQTVGVPPGQWRRTEEPA